MAFALKSKLLNRVLVRALVSCLTICQLALTPVLAQAAPKAQAIPEGWESYYSRPDILKVRPAKSSSPANWEKIQKAEFAMVAELFEIYPKDTHFYFLARDLEGAFDVAKLVTQGTADAARVHLLNISRANMEDSHVVDYIAENGISERALKEGKKVVFVDTGFAGTIPETIATHFSSAAQANLKTHLIVSENIHFPSSRAFLYFMSPEINRMDPKDAHNLIIDYEHMPRYTDRSSAYVFSEGKYHPISPKIADSEDGEVSKQKSMTRAESLVALWQRKEVREGFQFLRQDIRELVRLVTTQTAPAVLSALATRLENAPLERYEFVEAVLRDIYESANVTGIKVKVKPGDLYLYAPRAKIEHSHFRSALKRAALPKKYPHLKNVAAQPEKIVEGLIDKGDAEALRFLAEAYAGEKVYDVITEQVLVTPEKGPRRQIQKALIEIVMPSTIKKLTSWGFFMPYKENRDLVLAAIDKGTLATRQSILELLPLLSEGERLEVLQAVAATKDIEALKHLVEFISEQWDMQKHQKELRALVDIESVELREYLGRKIFSKSEALEMSALFRRFIEKSNASAKIAYIKASTTWLSNTKEYETTIKSLIDSGHEETLNKLAKEVLLKLPEEARRYLVYFVERAPSQVLLYQRSQWSPLSEDQRTLHGAMGIKDVKERLKYLKNGFSANQSQLLKYVSKSASAGGRCDLMF